MQPIEHPSEPAKPNTQPSNQRVVSSPDERLILVNSADETIGSASKVDCHAGRGSLHRAFSVFVENAKGQVLLQQRAPGKALWPGFWANSCCSHPRWGESTGQAVTRRVDEELGLPIADDDIRFLFKFEYQAQYLDQGSEHELCWVYLARTRHQPRVNPTEIADHRWVTPAALDAELDQTPERFTPWLHLEWPRVRDALHQG